MQKEWRSKDIVVIQKENNVYLEDDGNKISLNIEELIGLYVIFREIIENFNNRKNDTSCLSLINLGENYEK